MTSMHLKDMLVNVLPNQLPSNENYDRVETLEKKKPETTISGVIQTLADSLQEPKLNGTHSPPIIATASNLYKQRGAVVSEDGFIKLPRSLLSSDNWRNLTFRHQKLFLYLLERVQYTPRIFNHLGRDILVKPGQICITYRRLVDEFNQTIKFKKEKIDVPFLQRAVSVFASFSLAIHETIHGVMVLSICQKDLFDHFEKLNDTANDTTSIQDRYTNEERKKDKNVKETIEGACALDSSLLNLENKKTETASSKRDCSKSETAPSVFDPTPSKQTKDFTPQQNEHYKFLWKFIIENHMDFGNTKNGSPGIKEKDLANWMKKPYEARYIHDCLQRTLKANPSKTWPGYVNSLLVKEVPKKEENSISGKKYVEDFIKQNKVKHIDLKQDYFKDLLSKEDSNYNLPLETLKCILEKSVERFKQQEAEEKRQRDLEDQDYY